MTWLQIPFPGIAVYVVFLLSVPWYMRRAQETAEKEWARRYTGQAPLRKGPANFFGLSNRGMKQIGHFSLRPGVADYWPYISETRQDPKILPRGWQGTGKSGQRRFEEPVNPG